MINFRHVRIKKIKLSTVLFAIQLMIIFISSNKSDSIYTYKKKENIQK